MDNKTALFVGLLILGIIALDYFVIRSDMPLFLARKLAGLIETMAIWR